MIFLYLINMKNMKNKRSTEIYKLLDIQRNKEIYEEDLRLPEICIVPSIKEYLRTHSNISKYILDAYYTIVPPPENGDYAINGIFGSPEYYCPFEISVFGAYPLMNNWVELQQIMKIAYNKEEHYKYQSLDKNLRYRDINFEEYKKDKVLKRLIEFAKGFQYGFDNFTKDKIEKISSLSKNDKFRIQKVIDFLNSTSYLNCGFNRIRNQGNQNNDIWNQDGVNAGYNYSAWYYILQDHKSFESYFKLKNEIDNSEVNKTNSDTLNLIDPTFKELFLNAELKVLGEIKSFKSAIRCAAFCEMLLTKKIIRPTKTSRITLALFAKQRYNVDIKNSLTSAKKPARENHKNNKVNNLRSLKSCF